MHGLHTSGKLTEAFGLGVTLWQSCSSDAVALVLAAICTILVSVIWVMTKKQAVMLLDFYCFHPPTAGYSHLGADTATVVDGMRRSKRWNERSLDFMSKVSEHSGLGPNTYFPEGKSAILT